MLFLIFGIVVFVFVQRKCPKLKWFTKKRMNGICFLAGAIIGFSVAASNHFAIFDEFDDNFGWIRNAIYLVASFTNMCISIFFTGYILTIPFKLLTNLYQFTIFKHPKQKFLKLTGFYFAFGLVAIGVSMLMYVLAPTFLNETTSSDFSYYPSPLIHNQAIEDGKPMFDENGRPIAFPVKPTLFIIGNYMLIRFFKIKSLWFTFWFSIYMITIIITSIFIIYCYTKSSPKRLEKIMEKVTKIADKSTEYLTLIGPVFTFTAITVSLMVQPVGTILRISLVFILILILFVLIVLIDFIWALSTSSLKAKHFWKYSFKAFKTITKNPLKEEIIEVLTDDRSFRGFRDFNKEQNIYNIFVAGIFPIVIVAYLGFSAGPLYSGAYYTYVDGVYKLVDFQLWQHVVYWVSLYLFGYLLTFAYAFRYNDSPPARIMLAGAVPWIRTGFNTGILNYFNAYVNKLAVLATYVTFLAIACKHDKHYKKLIK